MFRQHFAFFIAESPDSSVRFFGLSAIATLLLTAETFFGAQGNGCKEVVLRGYVMSVYPRVPADKKQAQGLLAQPPCRHFFPDFYLLATPGWPTYRTLFLIPTEKYIKSNAAGGDRRAVANVRYK
jgi:hypothetical protein